MDIFDRRRPHVDIIITMSSAGIGKTGNGSKGGDMRTIPTMYCGLLALLLPFPLTFVMLFLITDTLVRYEASIVYQRTICIRN